MNNKIYKPGKRRISILKKIMPFIMVYIFISAASAYENKPELTVDKILQTGYVKMTGEEINKLIIGKKLIVKDLLGKSENKIILSGGRIVSEKIIKESHPGTLTDPEFQSRAALLPATATFTVATDSIIGSDKIRTYILSLYKKGRDILVARDIDHGEIYFQIEIEIVDSDVGKVGSR